MKIIFDPANADERQDALDIIALFDPDTAAAPAPVATAPALVVPDPTPDPIAGVALDANGTPHLPDVHAGTKSQTKAGVWTGKRGVAKEVVAAAELAARAKVAGTPVAVVPSVPVVPQEAQPQPVVSMDDVGQAFQDAAAQGVFDIANAMVLYGQLGVDPTQLTVNETMRASVVNHLNGLMGNPPIPAPAIPGIPGVPPAQGVPA